MDLTKLHKRGERVTVFWPGGPYDFTIEYFDAVPWSIGATDEWRDWFLISGVVVSPSGPTYHYLRTFYVHKVRDGYALTPYRGT